MDDEQPQLMYPAPLAPERPSGPNQLNGDRPIDFETPILIVGGGPVGMLQALILARLHSQPCMLVEKEATTTMFPKMEYTNGRSMEIYRKMGLHEEFRKMATALVPEDSTNDEIIVTSLVEGGKMVHVWERDSAAMHREKSIKINDGRQYLEPHLRCHQIYVEKWLKEKVEAEKLIRSQWATGFVGLEERGDHVVSDLKQADGTTLKVKSQYVIGCDGGGSWVRRAVELESKREYLNLTVAFVHFRSASLRSQIPFQRFWHANVIGGGLLVSQNESDTWTCHYFVPPGSDGKSLTTEDIIALTLGGCQGPKTVEVDEIYAKGVWKCDVAIANKFRSAGGRVFLAGDAAHQISPVGGHGLNSGLGDVFDLAWKLNATMKGWGGSSLLESYDTERRQIAFENISYVQKALQTIMAPVFGAHVTYGPEILNGDSEDSIKAREEVAVHCANGHWLHDQNGNILGYSYKTSPVILYSQEKGEERPFGDDEHYVPTTFPGSQAPRLWIGDGTHTIDVLSAQAFNIVDFSDDGSLSKPFVEGAEELGVPLKVTRWSDEKLRKLYERDVVLIRPDLHVAWRSSEVGRDEAMRVLRAVVGRES